MTKLKEKNRERLEKWFIDQAFEWFNDADYRAWVVTDGFTGVRNYFDEELLTEYKEWAYDYRDGVGHSPSI